VFGTNDFSFSGVGKHVLKLYAPSITDYLLYLSDLSNFHFQSFMRAAAPRQRTFLVSCFSFTFFSFLFEYEKGEGEAEAPPSELMAF
jgi:hypothetical protein